MNAKRLVIGAAVFFLVALCIGVGSIQASVQVELYLDTAPNASGSPAWPAFRDAAYASIYNDTFVNQQHSTAAGNVGTLNYAESDYMVYSFGDLGKRLHAFYYIPGATTASLAGRFQVSIQYDYAGVWYNPYQEYGWGEWVTPSSWINYDGNHDGITDGVMGSMGNALWGAYGFSADTSASRAALALDLQDAKDYLGDTRFLARLDGVTYELQALHEAAVPEPTTFIVWSLLGGTAAGYCVWRRRRAG